MSSRDVFVDSTAWIALLHLRDELHERATAEYARLISDSRRMITSSLVLVEVASALRAPRFRPLALELELRCRESRIGQVVWIDEEIYRLGWSLFRERLDKTWSLVDCTSIVLMEQRGIEESLTGDHHFEQAGFRRLL